MIQIVSEQPIVNSTKSRLTVNLYLGSSWMNRVIEIIEYSPL